MTDSILKCLFRSNTASAWEHTKESQTSFIFYSSRSYYSSVSERPWYHPIHSAEKLHVRIYTRLDNMMSLSPSISDFHKMEMLLLCKELWKLQKKKQTEIQWTIIQITYQYIVSRMPRSDAQGNSCWRHLSFKQMISLSNLVEEINCPIFCIHTSYRQLKPTLELEQPQWTSGFNSHYIRNGGAQLGKAIS